MLFWDNKYTFEGDVNDDSDIQSETLIYYSKVKNGILFLFFICLIVLGITIAVSTNIIVGILLTCVSLATAYIRFRALNINEPQIILNENGIGTSSDFFKWEDIKDEEVIRKRVGKVIRRYLRFNTDRGSQSVLLNPLSIKVMDLCRLLAVYRNRSNKKDNI